MEDANKKQEVNSENQIVGSTTTNAAGSTDSNENQSANEANTNQQEAVASPSNSTAIGDKSLDKLGNSPSTSTITEQKAATGGEVQKDQNMINLNIKTPKEKENVSINVNASIKDVL
jgi:hypothetical protein